MSFDYFSKRRMQYILEKLKTIFDTKADISDVPDTFADLTDTAFVNLQNGQVAIYNSTAGKWKNQNLPSSTDLFTITLTLSEDPQTGAVTFTSDKLPSEVIAAKNNGSLIRLTATDTADFDFNLSIDYITEEETVFVFTNIRATSNHQVLFVGFNLIKDANSDTWASIELLNPEFNETILIEMEESSGEYSCNVDFNTLDDAYYQSMDMIVEFESEFFRLVKYDTSEDTFYFANTVSDSNGIKTRTFVMVGDESENEWTSITLTESSGGDPNAIKWSEAETSVKKNWLPNNAVSQTVNGITYTVNADKSVLATGTASAQANLAITDFTPFSGSNNEFIGVGGFATTGIRIIFMLYDASKTYLREYADTTGSGVTFANMANVAYLKANIVINSGASLTNKTFYPMIRLASVEDATYVPYIPDNTELLSYADNNVLGAKNLLNHTGTSVTKNGLTITRLSDGRINVDGTVSSGGSFAYDLLSNAELSYPAGRYIFSFADSVKTTTGGGTVGIRAKLNGSSSETSIGSINYTSGTSIEFILNSNDKLNDIYINFNEGSVFSNFVFKPMIRLATDTDSTYAPYTKTNLQLTKDLAETSKNTIKWNEAKTSVKKNWLKPTNVNKTSAGITFTSTSNGGVVVSGTSTANWAQYITEEYVLVKAGTYIFSCHGEANDQIQAIMKLKDSGNYAYANCGTESVAFTLTNDVYAGFFITVKNSGTTVNQTVYAMLRLASVQDSTYVPYIPDNTELVDWKSNGILGAKNLLPTPYADTSKVQNDITWTYNSDGTVVVNGTATGNTDFYLIKGIAGSSLQWLNGKILSGVSNGSSDTYFLYLLQSNSPWTTYLKVYDGESVISGIPNDSTLITLMIRVVSGTTVSNLIFKPMIRLATDTDNTYVPYAPSNRDLFANIAPIKIEAQIYTSSTLSQIVKTILDNIVDSGNYQQRSFMGGFVWSGNDHYTIEGFFGSRYARGSAYTKDTVYWFNYDSNTKQLSAPTSIAPGTLPVWSSSVSALTGATSVTITNANIHTSSVIEPFADNGTNTAMSMPTMTVTEGQCVLGFDALTANTTFKLRITN